MSQLFISHAEEDQEIAVEIGSKLEQRGFGVWYYERDGVPGADYLDQMGDAIEQCEALVLIISQHSLGSGPVNAEVIRAFEANKPFVPLLYGVSRNDFHARRRGWRMALGAATSIDIPADGLTPIMDKIAAGVRKLGVNSTSLSTPEDISRPEHAVECSLFAPEIASGVPSLVHAWLHSVSQADDVMRISTEFDVGTKRRARQAITAGISVGTRVEFKLQAGKLPVKSLSTGLTWQGRPEAVVFRVEPPQDSEVSVELGNVTLYHESKIPLASINFKIEITGGKEPTEEGVRAAATLPEITGFRKAYLCYASENRAEVLRRVEILRYYGIEVFMDSTNLTTGENWEKSTQRMIDEADTFLLFWSTPAKYSQWVKKEWQYALKSKGPGFIRPVTLEFPLPPPPPELAHIHFNSSFAYLGLLAKPK